MKWVAKSVSQNMSKGSLTCSSLSTVEEEMLHIPREVTERLGSAYEFIEGGRSVLVCPKHDTPYMNTVINFALLSEQPQHRTFPLSRNDCGDP